MHPNAPNIKAKLVEPKLSFEIVGLLYQVHNQLGNHHREKQYGDTLEVLLKEKGVSYERERPITTGERKSNFVDFCIANKVLIDLKAKSFITKDDYRLMQRYLISENKELGFIVNFRQKVLRPKRILNYRLQNPLVSLG